MELKSIGKIAKIIGVTTIGLSIKNKKGIAGTHQEKEPLATF